MILFFSEIIIWIKNIYIILISQDYHHYLKCSLKYILKYDTVGNIYKLLGKCSFKYFDEHFINFDYHHYLKCSLKYILKYDTVGNIYKLLGKCSFKYFDEHFINLT